MQQSKQGPSGGPNQHQGTNAQSFDLAAESWSMPDEGVAIIRRLLEGNRRFMAGNLEHPHQSERDRRELARGQDPDLILVSCSDSRVSPSAIFDLGLGDIFSIENAGEVVIAPGQGASLDIASIEFMVNSYIENDRCGVLLVMGHTNCGAVSTTLETDEGASTGSDHLDLLIDTVRANIPEEVRADPGEHLEDAVKANASAVLNSILENSEIVRNAIQSENLVVMQGTYDLHTGQVKYISGIENLDVNSWWRQLN